MKKRYKQNVCDMMNMKQITRQKCGLHVCEKMKK